MAKVKANGFRPITITAETPEEAAALLAQLNAPFSNIEMWVNGRDGNNPRIKLPSKPKGMKVYDYISKVSFRQTHEIWIELAKELKRQGIYQTTLFPEVSVD